MLDFEEQCEAILEEKYEAVLKEMEVAEEKKKRFKDTDFLRSNIIGSENYNLYLAEKKKYQHDRQRMLQTSVSIN